MPKKKATTLTAKEAAKLVKSTKVDELDLDHITELGDGSAEALGKFKGALYLNGLETLSDKIAQALAKFKVYSLSGWPADALGQGC